MSLYITSLNSGSNGNCYYVGNDQEAVLIDAGLSCRQIEVRMKRLGLSLQAVKAIFVSHEHSDHISAIPQLARVYQLPVFITSRTLQYSRFPEKRFPIRSFSPNEPVQIGDLQVTAFPKQHDASDPHSFLISYQGTNVGVFTDIGVVCEHVIHHFKQCHAVFLEANYDEDMLDQGRYPYFLKQRIRGGKGHLSNQQALALFQMHKPPFMSHILLSHLSKENNNPQVVHDLFTPHMANTKLIVAPRHVETPVFRVSATASVALMDN
ncbi:MBL fold metallo-hydrolase [Spirosoma sp. KNUC1025]|uniref:MBL fold metallo-hydrolase n=1 Tax=Spirosoma sp. KNUC1025 TaxID=2894082 RepID=UPI0038655602|nr:MBL fold metallo-hydrolase [Spirosoma sp. KNUC1025]